MSEELSKIESLKKTKELLLKFKHDTNVQKLNDFYYTKSFGEILKVERKENMHSSFIAWIMDINEQHNLGDYAIRRFLDILLQFSKGQFNKHEELSKILYIGNYTINNFFIQTEYSIGKNGFIDIFISMEIIYEENNITQIEPINIIIENKVYSTENKNKSDSTRNQTIKYFNHFEETPINIERHKKDINFYVYLTPLSTIELNKLKKPQCECEEFIQINYQILSDNIFELIKEQNVSSRIQFIIEEYLKSLGKPTSENSKNKGKIMAIQTEEQKLLESFLNEHQELISTAINARLMNSDLEDEDRDNLTKINESLSNTRDLRRYENLEDYINTALNNRNNDNIERLRLLMNKIESIFGDKIKVTYAPSKINIANLKSKIARKVFVYITPMKDRIRLETIVDDWKNKVSIELSNRSEIENGNGKDNYIDVLKKAFESLEN